MSGDTLAVLGAILAGVGALLRLVFWGNDELAPALDDDADPLDEHVDTLPVPVTDWTAEIPETCKNPGLHARTGCSRCIHVVAVARDIRGDDFILWSLEAAWPA